MQRVHALLQNVRIFIESANHFEIVHVLLQILSHKVHAHWDVCSKCRSIIVSGLEWWEYIPYTGKVAVALECIRKTSVWLPHDDTQTIGMKQYKTTC